MSAWPAVLGAICVTAVVPLPMRTLCAVSVARPVPPCATDSGVVRPDRDVMLAFAPEVAIAELHPKPTPLVYWSACAAPLQPVMTTAVGDAVDAVTFASTVLAACAARLAGGNPPASVKVPLTVRLLNVGDG
ncbi:hypothetical protein WJ95_09380 [Burkholderia ubonensis]|nr:hypothetical protein WJ95_09380 [Burkholderia ubonensis]